MVADVSNVLIFETLERIQSDIASGQEIDKELLRGVSSIERMLSNLSKEQSWGYGELMENRHSLDKIRERLERLERLVNVVDV